MLEFLSPKRVAARKLARMIAQNQPSRPVEPIRERATAAALQFDPLERLLDEELRKYGLSLG
jgi:hypothetical protein